MLKVITIPVTLFEQNARLIVNRETGEGMIVDPGGAAPSILQLAEKNCLFVRYIFLTHAHLDHGGAVRELLSELGKKQERPPALIAHRSETLWRENLPQQARLFGLPQNDFQSVPEPDLLGEEGTVIEFGGGEARLIHTPGHSPGHLVLFFPVQPFAVFFVEQDGELKQVRQGDAPILFSGDTLFAGSVGRTDLYGGDYSALMDSIKKKLFALPDETVVFSGHGPETSIGAERRGNPYL